MAMNVPPGMLARVLLALALMLVWPIPHTIALRNVLLAAGFVWAATSVARQGFPGVGPARAALSWLTGFLVWMALQAAIFAVDASRAFGEIQGQWVPALAAGFFGFVLGRRAEGQQVSRWLWRGIVLVLAVHAAATLWSAAAPLWGGGTLLRRVGGLTEGPDKSNYLTVTLVCILLATFFCRDRDAHLLPGRTLLVLFPLVLATLYVEQIRNGLVSLALAASLLVAFLFTESKGAQRARPAVWGIVAAGLVLFAALALTDARWKQTLESAREAWHADTRSVVLHPTLAEAGGDPSAYLRLAMLKEGLAQAAAHPLGVGFHRNAFGQALRLAHGQGSGHSHSSVLDLAIGVGAPGVLLLVGFFLALMKTGWQTEAQRGDGLGLLLLLVAGATLGRAVLDSCLRDHMLQQTFFLFGLLLAASRSTRQIKPRA